MEWQNISTPLLLALFLIPSWTLVFSASHNKKGFEGSSAASDYRDNVLRDDYDDEYDYDEEFPGSWNLPSADTKSSCYDENNQPQRCAPEFSNAAAYRNVHATNTCGSFGSREFCRQMGTPWARAPCEICDVTLPHRAHLPHHMTDFNTYRNLTWWMSDTMEDGIDKPGQVNLTLDFRKSFDISYVRLRFYSSRPESFAIYKRTTLDSEWTPYQFYSATCNETYGIPDGTLVTRENETLPLCTSEFSDLSPLTGGTVVFSTLEGRPGAYDFENNQKLQEWVIGTAIRITLDKMNTFGDEIFEDPLVLKSYFFAISDLSVGARCRCYGHASDCIYAPDEATGILRLVCRCEHHTMGDDCEMCLPLFNQRPWAPATTTDANECLPCNCNGKSNKCYFDQELFDRTGSGGHCLECEDNTEGVNCERCKVLHYRRKEDKECAPCNCDSMGSLAAQCSEDGQCPCKPGVGTRTCSKCAPNFYEMTIQGCKPCGCNLAGIAPDAPSCDPSLGYCPCKDHVIGQRCDSCKKGYFDLQLDNEFGCVACFCYGHSTECRSAPGFFKKIIETNFDQSAGSWKAVDLRGHGIPVYYDADLQIIEVRGRGGEFAYFVAPDCYLGNQRASYNHYLTFTFRIGAESVRVSAHDVILEGAGLRVSVPITEQGNPIPSHRIQSYKFRLHENPVFGWTPQLNTFDFIKLLSNLTAVKIKATYSREGVGYLDDVILESAATVPGNFPATWVEQCSCPEGYAGLSCELCAPGYRREPLGNSPYSRCVKCFCHNHADTCDPDTGRCICKHNTEGPHCERCAPSYYGDAREGTSADCRPCLCPDRGPCVMLPGGQVACQQCPLGHTGHTCDMCVDGYFGDPTGRFGPSRPCRKCDCNGNIDPNAVGNCNTTTGQCLKCIYNTAGWNCDRCLPGYYGDALSLPKGGCKRCTCYLPGTIEPERGANPCESTGGQCRCKANVIGRRCDQCRKGYWNIDSGQGCSACDCNRVGSVNQTCDIRSGQCHCRPGVVGRHCDSCAPYHYGFSEEGCKACECDPAGSTSLQCDTAGQCQCRPNREGRRCHICRDNKFSRGTVCKDCPPCYSLLEEAIDRYKDKLTELANLMEELKNHPETVEDFDFQRKLREAERKITNLLDEAKRAAIADGSLISQLNELRRRIKEIGQTAGKVRERLDEGEEYRRYGLDNITLAENVIQQAKDAAAAARKYLDTQGRDAYLSALDRKDRLGQQSLRLSQIAREARQLADEQEEDAEVSDAVSNQALNTSTEAYRLARETLESQERMSHEVADLGRRLDDLIDFVKRTKDLAEDAKTEANTVYDEALGIYTDANSLVVPTADVEAMENEASRIKSEARRIRGQADSLANEHKDTLSKLDDHTKDADGLLNEAIRQQQITDELLTDTDAALAKALGAIASGEKILEDAKDTLDTLRGFDQQVKASQERANETLKKIPHVKRKVGVAENKTFDAEDALRGAIQDAADARDIAREAQRLAEQASQDADGIRRVAGDTKYEAAQLRGQAGEHAGQVAATDQRMRGFEDEADNDGILSKEALGRANEAKTAAIEAVDKGRNAAAKLDNILDALGDLDSVDNSQLDDLERLLALAERELINADLGARAEALREVQEEQKGWMKDYEDEIEQLRKDVANVAAIRYSLPDGCYRRLVLEP